MAEYANLLSHLHRPTTKLPLTTIHAAIAHHLARLKPYPTPLAAAVISSRLFRPLSHPQLQGLTTAFRHATHLKYKALQEHPGGLFSRSLKIRLQQWMSAVLKGLQGGDPLMRLACCGGVLLGLHDLNIASGEANYSASVEDEIVVALAEVMDNYAYVHSPGSWENEFQPVIVSGEGVYLYPFSGLFHNQDVISGCALVGFGISIRIPCTRVFNQVQGPPFARTFHNIY
jgi:hypothetical protein